MTDTRISDAIRVAESGLADAQTNVARLLRSIVVAPRAHKTTISFGLDDALRQIRRAREHLRSLETLIRSKDT